MTDLLRRIVEIEGWETDEAGFAWLPSGKWIHDIAEIDWASVGPLIEKHNVWIGWSDGLWTAAPQVESGRWEGGQTDPDLRTAIVKAIVEAHETTCGRLWARQLQSTWPEGGGIDE